MTIQHIPFDRPTISEAAIAEVVDSLRSGWITTGPKVKQFEADFAAYVDAEHAIALSSATAALHVALVGRGIGPGDEVITTPLTFCSTAHVVEHTGARVVLADVDSQTYNIDPKAVEAAITPRTRAVIPVHLAGLPCQMDALKALCQIHNLFLLEDAAHAAGATYQGQAIGAIGDATAFSFYATKNLTTAEGGMLTTNDADLAQQVRVLALHGMSRDAWKRYTQAGSWAYDVVEAGFKYNMPDVLAALGLWQLKELDANIAARRRLADRYSAAFANTPQLIPPPAIPEGVTHAHHLYILRLQLDQMTIGRSEFIDRLKQAGIGASVHFIPLYHHQYYRNRYRWTPDQFPNCQTIFESCLSLPVYPMLTDEQQDYIIETILDLAAECRV
jgi:dTDP-4-amino-4,6-dideoxygalactose transaminase